MHARMRAIAFFPRRVQILLPASFEFAYMKAIAKANDTSSMYSAKSIKKPNFSRAYLISRVKLRTGTFPIHAHSLSFQHPLSAYPNNFSMFRFSVSTTTNFVTQFLFLLDTLCKSLLTMSSYVSPLSPTLSKVPPITFMV